MNNELLENPNQKPHLAPASPGRSLAALAGRAAKANIEAAKQDSLIKKPDTPKWIILLVTNDTKFDDTLRRAAKDQGHILVRVESLSDALRTIRAKCTHVALLDLDMPSETAWGMADWLMQAAHCPPVLFMTGRTEQFDVRMAVHAGVMFDKASEPGRIFEAINKILEGPSYVLKERNAIQRSLIRWLSPAHWPARPSSTCRHWGINE